MNTLRLLVAGRSEIERRIERGTIVLEPPLRAGPIGNSWRLLNASTD